VGGDWRFTDAAVPAAVMDVLPTYSILLSDTCCVLGSSTMEMKDGSLGHRFDLVHRADTSRDLLVAAFKDLPFIQLRPLDLFGWQLLWVGGLF
jgi:hypothetical protein